MIICQLTNCQHSLIFADKIFWNFEVTVVSTQALDRRDATRERLLKAARELFVSRGYHATRPQDIARLAGLGQGTFYLYFTDKKACFVAFVATARLELQRFLLPRLFATAGLEAFFTALITAMLDYSTQNPGVLRAAMIDISTIAADVPDLSEQWATDWTPMLQNAIRRGAIDPAYDPKIVGAILVGAVGGAVAAATRSADRKKVTANTVRFLLRALRPATT
jgi:AcrR family transcriptional regulator